MQCLQAAFAHDALPEFAKYMRSPGSSTRSNAGGGALSVDGANRFPHIGPRRRVERAPFPRARVWKGPIVVRVLTLSTRQRAWSRCRCRSAARGADDVAMATLCSRIFQARTTRPMGNGRVGAARDVQGLGAGVAGW
eukprot:364639-Chlamydomonas_euryale.AAC.26